MKSNITLFVALTGIAISTIMIPFTLFIVIKMLNVRLGRKNRC